MQGRIFQGFLAYRFANMSSNLLVVSFFGVLSHTEVAALTLCIPIHAGQSTCLFPSLPLANT